ncbi:carboxypeptidase regulatory-like domain-containing protein, partial [Bacteroidota bacterium]
AGTVTEAKSGEYVIGITVTLFSPDTLKGRLVIRGAYTNKFGFYSIPGVKPGKYLISVGGIGYNKLEKIINVGDEEDLRIDIELDERDIRTGDVIIEADRNSSPTANIGAVEVEPSFIAKMPSLGEVDVFRALQLLPGVQQSTELSSGLYVRGGSPDQNLTLLDGAIVYNPSHLGGFLSTFNSDALRDIRLIKGAFPAEYGGRLSSVLDMTMKEGTKEKFSGAGGISLISSRLTVEGPIGEDVTFMVSGRRMYLGEMGKLVSSDAPAYYFYDLNAKLNYKISESDRIFVSGFFGRDVLESPDDENESIDIFWGNKTGNLRWMHIVSPTLFTNFSLIYTDYSFNTRLSDKQSKQSLDIFSGIQDITLRGDAQYFPIENHIIKTGIEATWHNFKAYAQSEFFNELDMEAPEDDIKTLDAALFIQDEWKITPLLSSNIGCRLYYFQNGNYLNLEPRLSVSYAITDKLSVNAAFAVANQYLHLLVRNDITLPTDLWFPSTENIKPSRSMQGSVGMEAKLFDGEYLFTTEVYYKDMRSIYEYMDGADLNFGVPLEEQFISGKGESYGLEVFLNKRIGKFTGWIGYTLAWTKRYFDDLNNGNWFYPRYDRRNDISVVISYNATETLEFSAAWVYGTGQAYTMPTGVYTFPDVGSGWSSGYGYWDEKYQYTERNGFRLPSYHRLDLNIMYNYEWFGLPFQFYISTYNTYNRRNPFAWYITTEENEETFESKKVVKQITLFPIIPTFGINFKF